MTFLVMIFYVLAGVVFAGLLHKYDPDIRELTDGHSLGSLSVLMILMLLWPVTLFGWLLTVAFDWICFRLIDVVIWVAERREA